MRAAWGGPSIWGDELPVGTKVQITYSNGKHRTASSSSTGQMVYSSSKRTETRP